MSDDKQIKLGLFWNAVNSFGRLGLNFLATVILARLLTPSDFGTYGILLIFITISELIADSGMGGYIVKKQNVDSLDYDTLFLYNLIVSCILYIVLYFSAPWLAHFYADESLIMGTRICGIVVIIQSVSIISTARLLKDFSFKILAIISLLSGVLGLISALVWGYFIGGYFALILQSLVSVSVNSLGVIWVTKYIPHLRFNFSRFKDQFSFGINLMGSTLLQSITNNISNNIIAKTFNMNLAGIYVQSAKLQSIPTTLIQSIADKTFFPVFAKLSTDVAQFNLQASQMSRMVYAFCFPLITLIICFARLIILIILGEQWIDCIYTFQILMFASYPLLVKNVNRNLLKALGFTRDIFRMEFYPFLFFMICIGVSIGFQSFLMMVVSIVLCSVFSAIMSMFYISKRSKQRMEILIKNILMFSPIILVACVSLFADTTSFISYLLYTLVVCAYIIVCYYIGVPEYVKIKHYIENLIQKIKY